MPYPIQCERTYVNPQGNVLASGYYRSYLTQKLANMFPAWMHLRQNPRSYGQQFLGATSVNMDKIERDIEYNIKSRFLQTAPIDEVDVLYRVKVPYSVDLTDASASGIRCVTAPSGYPLGGPNQIWVNEVTRLEDFYYNTLPTRLLVDEPDAYSSSIDGYSFNVSPSGILDKEAKRYDVWKNMHRVTWCYSDGKLRKQDSETMEDYEVYGQPGEGIITDLWYSHGLLWCLNVAASGAGREENDYYLNIVSTKTQEPPASGLDLLETFELSDAFSLVPSGILLDREGKIWICDQNKTSIYRVDPKYDYFILDKKNRYIYTKEDYSNPGLFISNT
jgi:hypothetical protein